MDKEIKKHLFVTMSSFIFLHLIFAIAGFLESLGILTKEDIHMPTYLGLICITIFIFLLSLVRPCIRLFILVYLGILKKQRSCHPKLYDKLISKSLISHYFNLCDKFINFLSLNEKKITIFIWIFYLIGLMLVVPAMIADGFFSGKVK